MIDSQALANLTSKQPWSKTAYFKEYQKSFHEGEYNLETPLTTPYGQSIRTYTSGGIGFEEIASAIGGSRVISDMLDSERLLRQKSYLSDLIVVKGGQEASNPAEIKIERISGEKDKEETFASSAVEEKKVDSVLKAGETHPPSNMPHFKFKSFEDWFSHRPVYKYGQLTVVNNPQEVWEYLPPTGLPEGQSFLYDDETDMEFKISDEVEDMYAFSQQILIGFPKFNLPYELLILLVPHLRRLIVRIGHERQTQLTYSDSESLALSRTRWIGHTHPNSLDDATAKKVAERKVVPLSSLMFLNNGLGLIFSKQDIITYIEYLRGMVTYRNMNKVTQERVKYSELTTSLASKYGRVILSVDFNRMKQITNKESEKDALDEILEMADDFPDGQILPQYLESWGFKIKIVANPEADEIIEYIRGLEGFKAERPYLYLSSEADFVSSPVEEMWPEDSEELAAELREIEALTEINGVPIEEIERRARPGRYSETGFLGEKESFKDVLRSDAQTLQRLGVTHQELAWHLRSIIEKARPLGGIGGWKTITYESRISPADPFVGTGGNAQQLSLLFVRDRGPQVSLFKNENPPYNTTPDNQAWHDSLIIKNLGNGLHIRIGFNEADPDLDKGTIGYIDRHGFYEGGGRENLYRVDHEVLYAILTDRPATEELKQKEAITFEEFGKLQRLRASRQRKESSSPVEISQARKELEAVHLNSLQALYELKWLLEEKKAIGLFIIFDATEAEGIKVLEDLDRAIDFLQNNPKAIVTFRFGRLPYEPKLETPQRYGFSLVRSLNEINAIYIQQLSLKQWLDPEIEGLRLTTKEVANFILAVGDAKKLGLDLTEISQWISRISPPAPFWDDFDKTIASIRRQILKLENYQEDIPEIALTEVIWNLRELLELKDSGHSTFSETLKEAKALLARVNKFSELLENEKKIATQPLAKEKALKMLREHFQKHPIIKVGSTKSFPEHLEYNQQGNVLLGGFVFGKNWLRNSPPWNFDLELTILPAIDISFNTIPIVLTNLKNPNEQIRRNLKLSFQTEGARKYSAVFLNLKAGNEYEVNIGSDSSSPAIVSSAKNDSASILPAKQNKDSSAASPAVAPEKQVGGIDFRSLPIVTQAMTNLSANISSSAINNLISINLNEEWSQIEGLANSGIAPSSERIKEYIQSSCAQDNITQDRDKILLCISDILRLQEERCDHTDPTLRDILVVLESAESSTELNKIFLGKKV